MTKGISRFIQIIILIILFSLLSIFSLKILHKVGYCVGWLCLKLPNPLKRIVQINIKLCFPERSKEAQDGLLADTLKQTGCTILEYAMYWFWSPEKILALLQMPIRGQRLMDDAILRGKGVILVGAHLGSWEMIPFFLPRHYPTTFLYRVPRLPFLDRFIKRIRARTGAQMVPASPAGIKMFLQALKRGEVVALIADQVPHHNEGGMMAPFFGEPAFTATLVARLAHKTGATVLMGYMERLADAKGFVGHYMTAPANIADSDLEKAATALNQGLAQCILENPTQYQWGYKRFKKRVGLPRVY